MDAPMLDRPDVEDARRRAHLSPDPHELTALIKRLSADERVEHMARAFHGGHAGLLVLTDRRLLAVVETRFDSHVREWRVDDLESVQFGTGTAHGTLNLFTGGVMEQVTRVDARSGRELVAALRARVSDRSPAEG